MSTPATFPPWSDTALRIALGALALVALAAIIGPFIYVRTPYNQERNFEIAQPVQFDHRHHVHDDGIECLYCHPGAENSAYAGVPATEVCMGCRSQVWQQSALLAPVGLALLRVADRVTPATSQLRRASSLRTRRLRLRRVARRSPCASLSSVSSSKAWSASRRRCASA